MNAFDPSDAESIFKILDDFAETQPSPIYDDALGAGIALVEAGDLELADAVGRVLIAPGRVHDAREAYKWFHIGFSQQGYSTEYRNEYEELGTSYLGPPGDFRNEGEVAMCIEELGVAALPILDAEAKHWLLTRGLGPEASVQ